MEFPYPSAEGLHVGHVYTYGGADTSARFLRMRGYEVFEPMGFDAFGIHSENFALKLNINPMQLTAQHHPPLPRGAVEPHRRDVRLVPLRRYQRPELLPLDPVDLRPVVQGRAGRPQGGARQLVPQ